MCYEIALKVHHSSNQAESGEMGVEERNILLPNTRYGDT